ncbi:DUF417 family protein [Flavobacterium sp. '19STA2R22 D10 B1']|uniref:DUF417 family protein n=1 Tax=Flavobacterium aerium TaxID=3037261 RepID=UPI00278C4215|nr:DUF417 family protein [Flavobacterium sp. '19STA2R22 D10 B1']
MKSKISDYSLLLFKIGYYISLLGTTLILLWIGFFKFTPIEAAAIKPLVEYHPFTSWMYSIMDVQTVSNVIGIIEIAIAIALLLSIRFHFFKIVATIGIVITFVTTLSFLLTTPGINAIKDGVFITDFFILKDIVMLGFGLMILHYPEAIKPKME